MGQNNSKILPEDNSKCIVCSEDLANSECFIICQICNIKIHSSCKSYYLSHRLDFPEYVNCQHLFISS